MSTYKDEIPDLITVSSQPRAAQSTSLHPNNDLLDDEDFPPDLVLLDETSTSQRPADNVDSQDQQQPPARIIPQQPVPLTILTGWLGSGKTTLLHNIVQHISTRSQTVAILQNETSAFMGVEKALTLTDEENEVFGEMLEIATGCVCCSVRSDFLLAIDTLLTKRHFDYVVLECSGIADVGNLVTSLWADRALSSSAGLDAVVCLVDAESLYRQLSQDPMLIATTNRHAYSTSLNILKNQLVYSDVAIVNKLDRCVFEALPGDDKCAEPVLTPLRPPRLLFSKPTTTTPTESNPTELSSVLAYITNLLSPTQDAARLDLTQNAIQNVLTKTASLSKQVTTVLEYIYKVNPTLQTHFSHHSNLNIDSILNLSKYTLGSTTIPTNSLNFTQRAGSTHSTSPPQSQTHHHDNTTKDTPQTSYPIRDGIIVWTENKSLIPLHYRNACANRHDHLKCSDNDHHDHHDGHHNHHHHHDDDVDGDCCHTHSVQSDPINDDPHGISTVIITLQQPDSYKPLVNDTCDAWGFNINKLTANLDEYLFGHLQRAVEEDWAAERLNFRERFHGGKEAPEAIVNDLLEQQKQKKIHERQAGLDKLQQTHTPDLSTLDAKTLAETLEVPQMDSIEQESIYRMKGVFSLKNRIPKWYLQSVFNTFDLLPTESLQTDEHSSLHDGIYGDLSLYDQHGPKNKDLWLVDEKRYCSLIVIGVNINVERLVDLFLNSLDDNDTDN